MQKIILGNDLAKRVFELETKLKDFAVERQKLFEDVFKLRNEIDEKEDEITDKGAQIQILQMNLNTLSSELEIMKHLRPQQPNLMNKKDKETGSVAEGGSKASQKGKNDSLLLEKNVVKPIRGGGGNVKNFERDNYLIFEKPSTLENSNDFRKSLKNDSKMTRMSTETYDDQPRTTRARDAESFKKFDEILKTKGNSAVKGRFATPLAIHTTMEDEEDEPDYQDVQQKLNKLYTSRHANDGQKTTKGFFSGVKGFFS